MNTQGKQSSGLNSQMTYSNGADRDKPEEKPDRYLHTNLYTYMHAYVYTHNVIKWSHIALILLCLFLPTHSFRARAERSSNPVKLLFSTCKQVRRQQRLILQNKVYWALAILRGKHSYAMFALLTFLYFLFSSSLGAVCICVDFPTHSSFLCCTLNSSKAC